MTYEQLFQNTLGKYSSASGAGVIVPIPVEPEESVVTDFTITEPVIFSNGGSGRYVSATLTGLEGIGAYDNQMTSSATAKLYTGLRTTQMWMILKIENGAVSMDMDFTEVENPDSLTAIDVVVTANLTLEGGSESKEVTFRMNADLDMESEDNRNYMCFTNIENTTNTITLEKVGTPSEDLVCMYTLNRKTWTYFNTEIEGSGSCGSIELRPRQKVWLKGIGTYEREGSTSSGFSQFCFQSTGRIDLSGNILSIWEHNTFDSMTNMPNNVGMAFNKKSVIEGTGLYYEFLKIVHADLTFDNISTVRQTAYTKPNASVVYSLFGATSEDKPNPYLVTCKLGFKDGVTITTVNGGSAARSPFANFFQYCTSLNEVWLPNWSGTQVWSQANFTNGVKSGGTMYIPQGKGVNRTKLGCPSNWTLKYYDPATGNVIEDNN